VFSWYSGVPREGLLVAGVVVVRSMENCRWVVGELEQSVGYKSMSNLCAKDYEDSCHDSKLQVDRVWKGQNLYLSRNLEGAGKEGKRNSASARTIPPIQVTAR
jgi:hypothetical protein